MSATGLTSRLVHADRRLNPTSDGAVHQPTSNSVLFAYEDVNDLVDVFQGRKLGHVYSRSSSSSNAALQNMLADLEGGVGALTFATGMAAISAALFSLLKAGDHLIVSRYLFGNTASLVDTVENLGVQVSRVDVTDVHAVAGAVKANTKALYLETIANPVTQVADLAAIGQLCAEQGIVYMVDNTMTPACIFDAKTVQASLVICSLTKYIGGHGAALGGAIVDTGRFDWQAYANIAELYRAGDPTLWGLTQIKKRGLRDMGATLAPEAAHKLSLGFETVALRSERSCDNAMAIALFLHGHEKVEKVYYPGLAEHPQHYIAREHFSQFGAILSVDLKPEYDIMAFLNHLQLVLKATHLGDTRTLALPVAHTIFYENGADSRAQMGINDNMIRFSVGIEDTDDLIADLTQALDKL